MLTLVYYQHCMRKSFLPVFLLLICIACTAQQKVANYFTGKYGTKSYEHFSFWSKDGKPSAVAYSYGIKPGDITLKLVGTEMHNGNKALKVQFPNKHILLISVDREELHVTDVNATYNKIFQWEYEAPVNGIGTFCDVCAEDETEAITIVAQFSN